jgi:hypothetical protein
LRRSGDRPEMVRGPSGAHLPCSVEDRADDKLRTQEHRKDGENKVSSDSGPSPVNVHRWNIIDFLNRSHARHRTRLRPGVSGCRWTRLPRNRSQRSPRSKKITTPPKNYRTVLPLNCFLLVHRSPLSAIFLAYTRTLPPTRRSIRPSSSNFFHLIELDTSSQYGDLRTSRVA